EAHAPWDLTISLDVAAATLVPRGVIPGQKPAHRLGVDFLPFAPNVGHAELPAGAQSQPFLFMAPLEPLHVRVLIALGFDRLRLEATFDLLHACLIAILRRVQAVVALILNALEHRQELGVGVAEVRLVALLEPDHEELIATVGALESAV